MPYLTGKTWETSKMNDRQASIRGMRSIGFWLAVAIAALQGLNAVRTFANPIGFATYMGLPLAGTEAAAWVQVYGLRAGFIAVITTILLIRNDFAALRWTALAALVMPLGDAWLTAHAGAPTAIVARHLGIAMFLVAAWFFLSRAARRQSAERTA